MDAHTWAYLYNSLIIFVSLSIVYFFRRRALARVIISGLWLFLGIINGCILAQRVTPFGYTDLKMVTDLLTMQNTNYFTAGQALIAVIGVAALLPFVSGFGQRVRNSRDVLTNWSFSCCWHPVFIWVPLTTQAAQE